MERKIFDGSQFVAAQKDQLINNINLLRKEEVIPKLTDVLVGNNPGSVNYARNKGESFKDVGMLLDVIELDENVGLETVIYKIRKVNEDYCNHATMVYMPLPERLHLEREKIVNTIKLDGDADSLRKDSPFLNPTATAGVQIVYEAREKVGGLKEKRTDETTITVIGATGTVGTPLIKELQRLGYSTLGCDKTTPDEELLHKSRLADILISVTGRKHSVTPLMFNGLAIIDIGFPEDVDPATQEKALFFAPSKGGVRHLTGYFLKLNVIKAAIMANDHKLALTNISILDYNSI